MDSISPTSTDLARRLLAAESAREKSSLAASGAASPPPVVRVCEKLRSVLTTFAGSAGFRSLLMRALTLAAARAPELAGVTVLKDGSLSGLESVGGKMKKGAVGDAEQMLVAQFLDLLVTFVGEALMLQLVSQAWPDLLASQLRSSTQDKI